METDLEGSSYNYMADEGHNSSIVSRKDVPKSARATKDKLARLDAENENKGCCESCVIF